MVELFLDSFQPPTQGAVSQLGQRDQAHLLAASGEFIERATEMTDGLERAQQQISDEGGHNLDLQGIGTAAQRLFDLERGLDPLPPVFDLPALFVQPGDAVGREIESIGQHPDQAAIGQLVADDAQQHLASRPSEPSSHF